MEDRLLQILVCPETKTRLTPADEALLERLNRAITQGNVRNKAGETVNEPLAGGLVREDGMMLYPVVDDIPVMLVDEAIPLDQVSAP